MGNATNITWLDPDKDSLTKNGISFPKLNRAALYICTQGLCSFPVFHPASLSDAIQKLTTHAHLSHPTILPSSSIENKYKKILNAENIFYIIGGFWIIGILLAFTPCVLPLILLIAGFLGGQSHSIPKRKVFNLSIIYVLALSITYAIAGFVAAVTGIYIQAYLQNVWILCTVSFLIFLLSLSLLGLYTIRLPNSWQHIVIRYNKFRPTYSYIQVAIMGIIATLIASPCLAAPLASILGFISETQNELMGAIALFSLGFGIGTPLLIATLLGTRYLPKASQWQTLNKALFGFLLMGMAIWLLHNVIAGRYYLLLWSGLAIFSGIYLNVLTKTMSRNIRIYIKIIIVMIFIYGIALFTGFLLNNSNPLDPLKIYSVSENKNKQLVLQFHQIHNFAELKKFLPVAQAQHKRILLFFTASWCSSCKKLEENIFDQEKVRVLMNKFILLKIDLTDMNANLRDEIKKAHVIGPPTILFVDSEGKQLSYSLYGYTEESELIENLTKVK